jgi:hypothetical protein
MTEKQKQQAIQTAREIEGQLRRAASSVKVQTIAEMEKKLLDLADAQANLVSSLSACEPIGGDEIEVE